MYIHARRVFFYGNDVNAVMALTEHPAHDGTHFLSYELGSQYGAAATMLRSESWWAEWKFQRVLQGIYG